MERQEFEIAMDFASLILIKKQKVYHPFWNDTSTKYFGVCEAIGDILDDDPNFGHSVSDFTLFMDMCWNHHGYWLGDLNKDNVELRVTALEFFRQYALDKKLYRKY